MSHREQRPWTSPRGSSTNLRPIIVRCGAPQWGDLTTMHGRRIRISVVSEDLAFAWHVHVNESAVTDDSDDVHDWGATSHRQEPILRARMLFNYGVLAEEVACA